MIEQYKEQRLKEFREELIKAYKGILQEEILKKGNSWFESFLLESIDGAYNISQEIKKIKE